MTSVSSPKNGSSVPNGRSPSLELSVELERARVENDRLNIPSDALRGLFLSEYDLSGLDLSGFDLTGADLSRVNLRRAKLIRSRLCNASLTAACLDEAEAMGADFTNAHLEECHAERSGFGTASFANASLFGARLSGSSFSGACLDGADLRVACLDQARLSKASLAGALFDKASLREADLEGAMLRGASFDHTDLRSSRLKNLQCFRRATWHGADIRDVDFCGAYLVRRFIMDDNYIDEFRRQNRFTAFLYWIWLWTSDCGRSLLRWSLWTAGVALFFACLYPVVDVDYGAHRTLLSPLYFSIVTLTTLGYGDVLPASLASQILVLLEVIIGYLALGGMLAILAAKMARRAD